MSNDKRKKPNKFLTKLWRNSTLINIVISVVFLALGVFMVINPELFTKIMFIVMGVTLLILGVLSLVRFFVVKEKSVIEYLLMLFGILALAGGVLFLFRLDFIINIVSVLLGVYILFTAVTSLTQLISFKRSGGTGILIPIILSILGIAAGILCILGFLIFPDVITFFTGLMLIIYEVIGIAVTVYFAVIKKRFKDAAGDSSESEPELIEAEAVVEE